MAVSSKIDNTTEFKSRFSPALFVMAVLEILFVADAEDFEISELDVVGVFVDELGGDAVVSSLDEKLL